MDEGEMSDYLKEIAERTKENSSLLKHYGEIQEHQGRQIEKIFFIITGNGTETGMTTQFALLRDANEKNNKAIERNTEEVRGLREREISTRGKFIGLGVSITVLNVLILILNILAQI